MLGSREIIWLSLKVSFASTFCLWSSLISLSEVWDKSVSLYFFIESPGWISLLNKENLIIGKFWLSLFMIIFLLFLSQAKS